MNTANDVERLDITKKITPFANARTRILKYQAISNGLTLVTPFANSVCFHMTFNIGKLRQHIVCVIRASKDHC